MTTMNEVEVRCAICGLLARKAVLTSTSSFGPPDLDLRPQGPARWALGFEVQRCDGCGYCAGSIGQARLGAREIVESTVYREVLERSQLPRLARSLFCAALVNEGADDLEAAGWRFLQAAWACDDKNAPARARICRERSAEMFARALEIGETEAPRPVVLTLVADIWRRAGRFDEAIDAASEAEQALGGEVDEDDEESGGEAAIAVYIRGLAEAGDDELHNVAEVFADEG